MNTFCRILAVLAIVLQTTQFACGDFRTLWASGDPAPYAGPGATALQIDVPSFNVNGELVGYFYVSHPSAPSQAEALVGATTTDGRFRVVARQRVALPSSTASSWAPSWAPRINNVGQVAFIARVDHDPSIFTTYQTVWSEAGGLHLVDSQFSEPDYVRFHQIHGISDTGHVLYQRYGYQENGSSFSDDDPQLLVERGGNSRMLFERYAPAPLPCDGAGLCSRRYDFLYDGAAITTDGTVLFGAQVTGFGVTTLNNDAIFESAGESTGFIVRDGDAAWGLPIGYRFSHVSYPHVRPNGELLFPSYLATPSGEVELKYSLFANTGGVERLVARHGAAAPGYSGSRTIGKFVRYFATETGRPVVAAEIDGGTIDLNDVALYREVQNQLTLIAQHRQSAPGIPGAEIAVDSGSLLLESPITGTSVLKTGWYVPTGGGGGDGLWQLDPQGTFRLLLRAGQAYTLGSGDVRTISSITPLGFTADGVLPIQLYFSDFSQALISWTDAPRRIAGDANGDGSVDAADYVVWRKNLGQAVLGGYGADADGDRLIGPGDYLVWRTNFGRAQAENVLFTVPEPLPLVLVAIALAVCRKRHSQRRSDFTNDVHVRFRRQYLSRSNLLQVARSRIS